MSQHLIQARIAAVVGSVVAAMPFVLFIRHDLVESKPYKIMASPLQEELVFAATWLPLVVIGIAICTGLAAFRRHPLIAPLLAVVLTFFASVGSVMFLTHRYGQDIPSSGDFGTRAVVEDFAGQLCRATILSLLLVLIIAPFIRAIRRTTRQVT